MALELQKTLLGKEYVLFIEVLYISQQRILKETEEQAERIRMDVYESREHRDAGFPALLRKRWENVLGDEAHPVPLRFSNQEEYRNCLVYIHQYLVAHCEWYKGAKIVEPIDLSDETPNQTTITPLDDVRDNPANVILDDGVVIVDEPAVMQKTKIKQKKKKK
jgi:hypothetical protein